MQSGPHRLNGTNVTVIHQHFKVCFLLNNQTHNWTYDEVSTPTTITLWTEAELAMIWQYMHSWSFVKSDVYFDFHLSPGDTQSYAEVFLHGTFRNLTIKGTSNGPVHLTFRGRSEKHIDCTHADAKSGCAYEGQLDFEYAYPALMTKLILNPPPGTNSTLTRRGSQFALKIRVKYDCHKYVGKFRWLDIYEITLC